METGGGPPELSETQPDKGEEETVPSLFCVQCTRELIEPHLLCCLHFVCKKCLGEVEQQDGRLKCPECEDTSTYPIPLGEHNWKECPPAAEVQCVPVRCESLAQHIEDHRLLQRLTDGKPIPCNNCNKSECPATVVCFNCKTFLCQKCNEAHHILAKLTEGHTVKSLSELHSRSPSILRSIVHVTPTTCPYHEEKSLKYCCKCCGTLLCQACTVENDPKREHQPRFLDSAAVAPYAQCLVKAIKRGSDAQSSDAPGGNSKPGSSVHSSGWHEAEGTPRCA